MEIVEKRSGFCYNIGQVCKYKNPSQEELRAFLFSESERFSTFVIKYNKRRDIIDNEDQFNNSKDALIPESNINTT
jgi:hypothetical protein